MPGWHGALAQRASILLGAFFLATGTSGLIVNPDFGTGANLSAEMFLVDWNGWHAVATLGLAATAFVAAARPVWAVGFLAYSAVVNLTTAVLAMFDKTPLGLLALPNVATDVALHVIVATTSAVVVLIQLRRDRGPGVATA